MRLIDADRLLEKLKGIHGIEHTRYDDGLDTAEAVIDVAETVDPVKHGHWIVYPTLLSFLRCSQCRNGVRLDNDKKPNYCLYCGAKMDESSLLE